MNQNPAHSLYESVLGTAHQPAVPPGCNPVSPSLPPLRHVLTRSEHAAMALTAGISQSACHQLEEKSPSIISGYSDMSTPDRFSLRHNPHRAHEVATPCSKRASDDATLHPHSSRTGQHIKSDRMQSFSAADLDAAAAMLELPAATASDEHGSSGGSSAGTISSHGRVVGDILDSTPRHIADRQSTPPAEQGLKSAAFLVGADADNHGRASSVIPHDLDSSAESAAQLLLAAGRLASVTSQSSRAGGLSTSQSPAASKLPSSDATPHTSSAGGPTAATACAAQSAQKPHEEAAATLAEQYSWTASYYESSGAGFDPRVATDPASGFYAHAAAGMGMYACYDMSTPALLPGTASANAGMQSLASRPAGCSCLKPCKPHTPCQQCGSPHSPGHTWRAGPAGPGTLCNACGTRYSRSKQKQMAAAAAAFAAGAPGEVGWSGSSGGSSAAAEALCGSSGVGKALKTSKGRVGKGSSAGSVVKGLYSRSSGNSRPYGVLAALQQHWAEGGKTLEVASALPETTACWGGVATAGVPDMGISQGQQEASHEQQLWMYQWQLMQQQQEAQQHQSN